MAQRSKRKVGFVGANKTQLLSNDAIYIFHVISLNPARYQYLHFMKE